MAASSFQQGKAQAKILAAIEPLIYGKARIPQLIVLGVLTVIFAWSAAQTRVDAGFDKSVPLEHHFMQVYKQYQDDFGGANTVLIALIQTERVQGDLYNEKFLSKLKAVTDDVFFLPGVDRSRVSSLFTPDVRFLEVVEGGFSGGNVIPAEYAPTEEMFALVRGNVGKGGHVGRFTTNDQRGAMIYAELLEVDPVTGQKLDYQKVATELENTIRGKYQDADVNIHILGFAKVIGDVTDAANEVVGFFGLALVMTFVLLILYLGSFKLALLPLLCAFVAVVWEFGLLTLTGFGIDPYAILVPFLVLAVSVSHGVQYASSWVGELAAGRNSYDASVESFRRLAIPGTTALITDLAGFLTILLIPIGVIREMALNASYGMFAIIITNKILMPILLTYINIKDVQGFMQKQEKRDALLNPLFRLMSYATRPFFAAIIILGTAATLGLATWLARGMQYGDSQAGVPELRPDSRYNKDSNIVAANFAVGTDILKVIAEADPEACIHFKVMEQVDRFGWRMENTPGVSSILSLPWAAKKVNAAFSEASPKWKILPRNQFTMVQAITPVPTSSGFLNPDCSAMPVVIFTADHKATTIKTITDAVERFNAENAAEFYETNPDADAAYCDEKTAARREAGTVKERLRRNGERLKAKEGLKDAEVEAHPSTQKLVTERTAAEDKAKSFTKACPTNFALATGQVGVMAASNEVVKEKDIQIVLLVYAVIVVFLFLSYWDIASIVSIVLPLLVVSAMIQGLMALVGIGMKVATLPVAALAVGIGVDYGIYIYSTILEYVKQGKPLQEAYYETLRSTGKAVLFTGFVLTLSVSTWLMSGLQFQADMGLLLAFAFFANMIGALFGCPALCRYFMKLPNG